MTNTDNCPVCNCCEKEVLDLRSQIPTLQNITFKTLEEALSFSTGDLSMCQCRECGFVWNSLFDESLINYNADYDNDVSGSEYYNQHLKNMADKVLTSVPEGQPIHYVEIGCGQADFLKLVVERSNGRVLTATGFDPSFSSAEELDSRVTIHKSFFDKTCLPLVPEQVNVVCSRHTIEHVKDVRHFLECISSLMTSPNRKLIIETPDAEWILNNVAFQDFFYEHCSLFTASSTQRLLSDYNLEGQISNVYDGQYLWVEAVSKWSGVKDDLPCRNFDSSLGAEYIKRTTELVSQWSEYIEKQSAKGPVAIWGAASKGVTFSLLFLEKSRPMIDYAIDLNVEKQNRYLPKTGVMVISPEEAANKNIKTVIVMNPNYQAEILKLAEKLNWNPEFSTLNDS